MKTRSKLDKKKGGQFVAYTIAFCIMFFFCLSYLVSFLWAVFASTKTNDQIIMQPFALHSKWLFSNFAEVFLKLNVRGVNASGMITNSLYLVLILFYPY